MQQIQPDTAAGLTDSSLQLELLVLLLVAPVRSIVQWLCC